jgi:hypothetical protein
MATIDLVHEVGRGAFLEGAGIAMSQSLNARCSSSSVTRVPKKFNSFSAALNDPSALGALLDVVAAACCFLTAGVGAISLGAADTRHLGAATSAMT